MKALRTFSILALVAVTVFAARYHAIMSNFKEAARLTTLSHWAWIVAVIVTVLGLFIGAMMIASNRKQKDTTPAK